MAEAVNPMEEMMARMRREFLDTVDDRLGTLDELVSEVRENRPESPGRMSEFRRIAHSLKGMGSSFGFPAVTLISHRLEDYLARAHTINVRIQRDIDAYCQCLKDIISTGEDPGSEEAAEIIRALPTFSLFDVEDIVPLTTEVLLVTPSKTIGAIVGRGLAECGYKVTRFANAWEAMQFAASTKPNLVITAAVMEIINGVNLTCALAAMELTADIPVALLTSLGNDSRELEKLPNGVAIIRHGENFSEDLAEMLAAFETGEMHMLADDSRQSSLPI